MIRMDFLIKLLRTLSRVVIKSVFSGRHKHIALFQIIKSELKKDKNKFLVIFYFHYPSISQLNFFKYLILFPINCNFNSKIIV